MKTTTILMSLVAVLTTGVLTGCDTTDPEPKGPSAFSDDVLPVPLFIETAGKTPPADPNEPLYEARAHQPIVAPDGHHVTLREFTAVEGTASVTCGDGGVDVALTLSGLLPNGVYTIWLATFKAPGLDPAAEDLNMLGMGTLGPHDGSKSAFVASADGKGHVAAFTPGGALSVMGRMADCPLIDEYEWHVAGAFHMDGKTHGPILGPDGTAVEQFVFIFRQP